MNMGYISICLCILFLEIEFCWVFQLPIPAHLTTLNNSNFIISHDSVGCSGFQLVVLIVFVCVCGKEVVVPINGQHEGHMWRWKCSVP